MSKTQYDLAANRKEHSDTLYFNILGFCLIVNAAFGAGAGVLIRDMDSYRDCGILVFLAVAGWALNRNFSIYLMDQKNYQKYLREYCDERSDEFSEFPNIFDPNKISEAVLLESSWRSVTGIIAKFWLMVLFFGIGVAVRIYNG